MISVNGVSLEGKTRHDAVDLVRQSLNAILMGIMRIKGMYSSNESVAGTSGTGTIAKANGERPASSPREFSLKENNLIDAKPSPAPRKAPNLTTTANEFDLLKPILPSSDAFGSGSMQWMDDTAQKGGVSFHPNSTGDGMYGGLPSDSNHLAHSSDNKDEASQPHHRKRSPPTSSRSITSEDEIEDRIKRNNNNHLKTLDNEVLERKNNNFLKSNEKVNKDWTDEIHLQDIAANNSDWKNREVSFKT